MRYKKFYILICLLLLAGCWDSKELTETAFLAGIAIEKEGSGYKATFEVLDPVALKNNEEESSILISNTGDSFQDCIRMLTKGLKRRLFLSHTLAVIISTEVAEEDVFPVMDHKYRDRAFRLDSYVFVADKPADLLGLKSPLDHLPSFGLGKGAEIASKDISNITPISIEEFIEMSMSPTGTAYLMRIEKHKEEKPSKEHIDLKGSVIFKDGKTVKTLQDDKEVRGMLWFKDKVEAGVVFFKTPDDPSSFVSIDLEHNPTSKILTEIKNNELKVDIIVNVKGVINEWLSETEQLDQENFYKTEKAFADAIKVEMETTLKKLQEDPVADILDIGLEVYRQHPEYWNANSENWDNIFKNLAVNIHVDGKLLSNGLIDKQHRSKEKKKKPEKGVFPWN